MIRRAFRHPGTIIALCLAVFFGANYSWTHAAFAAALGKSACDAELSSAAEARVAEFMGDLKAKPWTLCLDGPRAGLSVAYGTTRFAPLLPAIVVLGPKGQNVDVAAHELLHAEIAARTSVLLRSYRLPTWFDEGLAMQVDLRPDYGPDAIRGTALQLSELSKPRDFFDAGEQGVLRYAFAKCVVGKAIAAEGKARILKVLDDTGWQNAFPAELFAPLAARCTQ